MHIPCYDREIIEEVAKLHGLDPDHVRCLERAENGETRKMILQQMRKIDRDRATFHELLTDKKWGEKETYHLCINTSSKEIKQLVSALAEYVRHWFDSQEEKM